MVPLCVPVCTCSNKILFSCRVSAWVGLRGCYIVTERLCCQCPSLSSRFYLIVLHCASLLSQLILQPSSDGQIEKSLWYILFFTSNFHCCPVECQIEGVVGEWLKNARNVYLTGSALHHCLLHQNDWILLNNLGSYELIWSVTLLINQNCSCDRKLLTWCICTVFHKNGITQNEPGCFFFSMLDSEKISHWPYLRYTWFLQKRFL